MPKMKIGEVAGELGVSEVTVWRLIHGKQLPAIVISERESTWVVG